METSPATAPEITPSTVGFLLKIKSMTAQVSPAIAVAICVTTNALAANPLALRALPALNPNQPTHSRPAPTTANGKLCGGDICLGYPSLLPRTSAAARAAIPALM